MHIKDYTEVEKKKRVARGLLFFGCYGDAVVDRIQNLKKNVVGCNKFVKYVMYVTTHIITSKKY